MERVFCGGGGGLCQCYETESVEDRLLDVVGSHL